MLLTFEELLWAAERKEIAGVDWESAVWRFCSKDDAYRKLRNNEADELYPRPGSLYIKVSQYWEKSSVEKSHTHHIFIPCAPSE